MSTVSEFKSKDKVKALRARIDDSVETLARAVDEVRASETFRAYLDMQAKFHRYSWCNSLLIMSQRPDATQVAGYRTWQKLKRQVRKGEHGIMIFAPSPWSKEQEKPNGDTETVSGMFFRAVHVLDVSQTDGEALPTVDVPNVETVADGLLSDLVRVADSRGIRVEFGPIDGGAFGMSHKGKVDVDNTHATGQQAKTLAHELAHESLHWEDRGPLTRSIAELEAESVAYVVCRHFGLDVEVRASRYIALWDGNAKSLRESLQRISETARAIIDDVEAPSARKAVA
jgi:antirestriction protein ArdC